MAPVPAKFHQRRRRTARRESDVIWHLPTCEGFRALPAGDRADLLRFLNSL